MQVHSKRVDIDGEGDDLYVYSYDVLNKDELESLHYTVADSKQAGNDVYGDYMEANADTSCLRFNNALTGRLQIANEGTMEGVNDGDCMENLNPIQDGKEHHYQ